jgi:flagellar protein FliO/FliZ
VVVVEIGASWLVLGVAAGGVNLLQQMPRAEMPASTGAASTNAQPTAAFASWLKQVMDKRNAK